MKERVEVKVTEGGAQSDPLKTYCDKQHSDELPHVFCELLKGHPGDHMAHNLDNPPSNGWYEWLNETPPYDMSDGVSPPALGVSVSDGIATKDRFGG